MVNILVVDDSAVDRKIAGGLIAKHEDWSVSFAEDGRQALEMINASPPDVIVTDLQMPEVNGLELVREVNQEFPLIPVILMTAQGSEAIAVEALQLGASSYVPKSLLPQMLVDTVRQVISLASERRTKKSLMTRMTRMDCQFILNNDPAVLTSLVSHISNTLNHLNLFTESDRLRVGVALEEALLNASYHGNLEVSSELRENDHALYYNTARERAQTAPYQDRSIYVDVSLSTLGLKYTIRDEGPGFDPSKLPDPTDPANLERPCGRGLLLMRTFMDEICYNDKGNQVTMTKSCKPKID